MRLFLILTIAFVAITTTTCRSLREEFTWTRISYVPQTSARSRYLKNPTAVRGAPNRPKPVGNAGAIAFPGATNNQVVDNPVENDENYIYQNNIPMGANVWNGKLFVTVPRRRLGVPSTLNYVWLNSSARHNVPLIPFPNYEINAVGRDNFVSVYRVAVDACDRLWFVDTGIIEIPGNATTVHPPTLVIMDLNTEEIIRRYEFDPSLTRPTTTLASVTLDTDCNGNDFAYMPDLGGYGLIVYNYQTNRAYRIAHNYFFLEPLAGEFFIAGHNFQWNDGIFSVALTETKPDGYRDAYFHSMAGFNMYKVSTRVLKNETLATRSYHDDNFKLVGNRGELSQASSSDIHKSTGILFMGLVNQNALACWNTATSLRDISIIKKDNARMIYPCDLKVRGDDVILLTNTMPGFLYGALNYDEVNFRVWIENVEKAVEGTKCARRRGGAH